MSNHVPTPTGKIARVWRNTSRGVAPDTPRGAGQKTLQREPEQRAAKEDQNLYPHSCSPHYPFGLLVQFG